MKKYETPAVEVVVFEVEEVLLASDPGEISDLPGI
jgi:hypothetical protein